MKKLLLYLLAAVALTSCNSSFYQIISTESNNALKTSNGNMIYQDNNCSITYNLWAANGNSGFLFTNKTDQNIYIDLNESFFIMNGIAYDYYLNRTYTKGKAVSTTTKGALWAGGTHKSNISFSFNEKAIVCVPGNSSKYFNEYNILQSTYRECGFELYPKGKEVKTLSYTETSSPVKFANKISYKIGSDTDPIVVVNDFYADKITNKTSKMTNVKEIITQDCDGKKLKFPIIVIKMIDQSPNSFYIRYDKLANTKTKY